MGGADLTHPTAPEVTNFWGKKVEMGSSVVFL